MLQLTKRTEYGLIALVALADRFGDYVSVREISERYHVPRRLLAEVLKELSRAGLVGSQRGASGGYALTRPPDSITLARVVTALEGPPQLSSCEGLSLSHNGECELESCCPIRSPLQVIRDELVRLLERTTLSSLRRSSRRTLLDFRPAVDPTPSILS